ncbi:hypothetical protein [Beggiatoa leptomitoformis]|uniref:Uncharacterized protein n=1 Tax=Beggiatoa leptomitoformis TaxID=288004 RepID=A0A2N9YBK3_9GAMM|nr:hypothetical protein [Beggiatoa leptomitoformis]ALG66810.1 hypothetical protein AL038_02625 [Beggiatoa leptomitoformis]AUI67841.1 hypothetical protein BLE401_03420 [Beggiatoa leptomitoformis]
MAEKFSFKTLAQNVLTLEINTIVKTNMLGCKLPNSRREALWEIAYDYNSTMRDFGYSPVPELSEWSCAGIMAFLELRERAKRAGQLVELELERLKNQPVEQIQPLKENLTILNRIKIQSEQLVSMFISLAHKAEENIDLDKIKEMARTDSDFREKTNIWNNDIERQRMQDDTLADLDLSPSQISFIRKIWEIGTERIVLQTVIQVEGDITTRISEYLIQHPNPTILKLHNESILTSVQFWSNLVKTVGEFAGGLVSKILK